MIGLMRVKNEARWIERSIQSILPICEQVLVFDDHSTDDTRDICAGIPYVTVFDSPFVGLDETRDKSWLLEKARKADWILMIDGDEILAPSGLPVIHAALDTVSICFSLPVYYLWDREDQVRVDGVYGRFARPSIFQPGSSQFEVTGAGGNFHCGNAPLSLQPRARLLAAPLLHLGYMHKEDRIRKYEWYNLRDPNNPNENGYRHLVVGDVFPADSCFRHGGPLACKPLEEMCTHRTAA